MTVVNDLTTWTTCNQVDHDIPTPYTETTETERNELRDWAKINRPSLTDDQIEDAIDELLNTQVTETNNDVPGHDDLVQFRGHCAALDVYVVGYASVNN